MKFKVSFQLSPNRFGICWVLDVWTLNEIRQNHVFGHISLPFLCVKSGILYNYIMSKVNQIVGLRHGKIINTWFGSRNTLMLTDSVQSNIFSAKFSIDNLIAIQKSHTIYTVICMQWPCYVKWHMNSRYLRLKFGLCAMQILLAQTISNNNVTDLLDEAFDVHQ